MPAPLKIVGAFGSPYSRKMRAVLRYRRIPFRWINSGSATDVNIPEVPVSLIPVLVFPGSGGAKDEAMIDSTPQIRRLEQMYDERGVVPPDPAVSFVDELIEDFADEWLTKAMFHYRWSYDADIFKASRLLPLHASPQLEDEVLERAAHGFAERQIGRLEVVGSNETTKPVIESSYRRLLGALDEILAKSAFITGGRPGASDFAVFGQLSQLALFDPTSSTIAVETAPRVVAWLERVEDLSWLEISDDSWVSRDEVTKLRPLLEEIGRVYVPFLLANAAALERGDDNVDCEIDGKRWVQKPFRYQGHCLRWLREHRSELAGDDRAFVDAVLEGTGCSALFS